MAQDLTPNLRALLTEFATWASERHPAFVTKEDVERIAKSTNTLLVLSRVLAQICVRAGLSKGDLDAMVSRCKGVDESDLMDVVESIEPQAVHVTGRMEPMAIIRMVDEALMDPKSRSRMPAWFIDDAWPGILRRAARNVTPTPRELEVALGVVSEARGER